MSNSLFNALGFDFPKTSEELDLFRKIDPLCFKGNPENIDPKKILNSVNKKLEKVDRINEARQQTKT